MTDKDRQFLENARQVLDDSVHDLDGATRARLAQARNAALDSRRTTRRRLLTWATPAAGLAAAALVGVLVWRGNDIPTTVPAETYVADLEILADEEGLEFYENIEFYQWLSEVEHEEDISGDRGRTHAPIAARTRDGAEQIAKREDGDDQHGPTESGDAGVPRLV